MPQRPDWKNYQARLKRGVLIKRWCRHALKCAAVLPLLLLVVYGLISVFGGTACQHATGDLKVSSSDPTEEHRTQHQLLNKNEIQPLIEGQALVNRQERSFDLALEGRRLQIDTSLDIPLQKFLLKNMERSLASPRYVSRYVGIVVMEPSTGRILSMVGFNKQDQAHNPCTDNIFPAASIFKIVTAAAAIEKCGFDSGSRLTFNGRKYTLYKSQLKESRNKYTNRITFKDSFAQSVNPVFGKLGAHYLKKDALVMYATAFGFNHQIDFEIALAPSHVNVSDEPYHWAEIASGFNRETILSPVHGALLASAILNQGKLIEPSIIDQITDENGRSLYRSRPTPIRQAITARASRIVNTLMKATVRSGTSRKAFKGSRRDPVLSRLHIGGKTGSIANKSHDIRYDWFVGFAETKQGSERIAIAAVVAHEKYIGTRASQYARLAIKQYFRDYFVKTETKSEPAHLSS